MATVPLSNVVQQVRSLTAAEVSDRDLLVEYIHAGDESAFAAIIRRHGRVVLGVCSRLLGNGPDADDAFQATFFVLARKAASIRKQASLASWLHGVAHRVSSQLRAKRARQRQRETSIAGQMGETDPMRADPSSRASLREMGVILDEELQLLPPACRDALVLCLMENVSHPDAAKRLGCPLGTVKSRLQRGRELLRQRLEHRGIELTGIALTVLMAEQGRAAVSASLLQATLHGAARNAASPAVAALAKTVLATMGGQLKAMLAVIVVAGVTMAGVGVGAYVPSQEPAPIALRTNPPTPLVQAKPEKKIEQLDAFGDALPEGAPARLGTVRWRHGGQCGFVAFLPGGNSVLTAGTDSLIRIWEYPSGKELRRFGVGERDAPDTPNSRHDLYVHNGFLPVALSPDSKVVACDLNFGGVRLYEIATGKELLELKTKNDNGFEIPVGTTVLAFSPDSKTLAVLDHRYHVKTFDVSSGRELRKVFSPGPENANFTGVPVLANSPDGKRLFTMSMERIEKKGVYFGSLWDPESGERIWKCDLGEKISRLAAEFSPDGKLLAFADTEGQIVILSADTGKEVSKLKDETTGKRSVRFGPDGKTLFTNDLDANVCEWDLTTGKKTRILGADLSKRQGTRWAGEVLGAQMALSPNGEVLALCGVDHLPHFLDLASGKEIGPSKAPAMAIDDIQFGSDGKSMWARIAANKGGPHDGCVFREWELTTGKEIRSIATDGEIMGAAITKNGEYRIQQQVERVPSKRITKEIQVIENATGKKTAFLAPPIEKGGADMHISPDGAVLILRWFSAQTIEFYDLPSLTLRSSIPIQTGVSDLKTPPRKIPGRVFVIAPDGKRVAAYSDPDTFSVWQIANGKKTFNLIPPEGLLVHDAAFTADSRCLALSLRDGTIILHELLTGKVRGTYGEKAAPMSGLKLALMAGIGGTSWEDGARIAISPHRDFIAFGGLDRIVRVWDFMTSIEVKRFSGHSASIQTLAFSPDAKLLASASKDTTALIWDVSNLTSSRKTDELSAADLDSNWKDLGSDSQTAFRAIRKLVDSPKGAVPLLKERLKPVPRVDEQRIISLIADLGSDTFKTRDSATKELEKLGELAGGQMEKALAGKITLEMKQRIEQLLDKLEGSKLPPEILRQIRAVEVLEFIATPAARELLQSLVEGAPGARLTRESQEATVRLAKAAKGDL